MIIILVYLVYGSLWHFKRDDVPNNNADLAVDNSQSFSYKAALVRDGGTVLYKTQK